MKVRKALEKDIPMIENLLSQVDLVHHNGRPDIFKIGTKYNAMQIKTMLGDESKPILVCVDENDEVLGYCFCIFVEHKNDSVLTDVKSLYVDDLCVDESMRKKGVGKVLLNNAIDLAKSSGCYNVTLNVWSCNAQALKFYENCGFLPQKIVMEKIVKD